MATDGVDGLHEGPARNIYAELDGDDEPPAPLAAFQAMAELAASR